MNLGRTSFFALLMAFRAGQGTNRMWRSAMQTESENVSDPLVSPAPPIRYEQNDVLRGKLCEMRQKCNDR